MPEKMVKRSQRVAFYGVTSDGETTFYRMTGFTEMAKSANPKEYTRQYIDEEHERSDIVGYSPEFSYSFDMFAGNPVHEDIAAVSDEEKTGTDAVREIVIVDLTQEGGAEKTFKAVKRAFSVIPNSEGNTTDAYTYSGSLKVVGDKVVGTATSEDNWQTIAFTE